MSRERNIAICVFVAMLLVGGIQAGGCTTEEGKIDTSKLEGKIVFSAHAEADNNNYDLYMIDANGENLIQLTDSPRRDYAPVWSPDGTRIAYISETAHTIPGICIIKPGESDITVVDTSLSDYNKLSWSPDGTKVVFDSERNGTQDLYVADVSTRMVTRLTNSTAQNAFPDWSPDGSTIVFASRTIKGQGGDLYLINPDGSQQRKLTWVSGEEFAPVWSPDGSKVAYIDVWKDNWDIYVINADGSGRKRLTHSSNKDTMPAWSPDGTMIIYASEIDSIRRLYVMNSDGSSSTLLAWSPEYSALPDWRR